MTKTPSRITDLEEFQVESSRRTEAKPFKYRKPDLRGRRALVPLVRSDITLAMVQVFRGQGGEQELHSHSATDGFWFVLNGQARFYSSDNVLLAELEKHDGIFIPREFPYWFESCGKSDLELLQVESIDRNVSNSVTRYNDATERVHVQVFKGEGELIADNIELGQ